MSASEIARVAAAAPPAFAVGGESRLPLPDEEEPFEAEGAPASDPNDELELQGYPPTQAVTLAASPRAVRATK